MDLTPAQLRILESLIGRGPPTPFDPELLSRTRDAIEARLLEAGVRPGEGEEIWLGKHRLNDRERCEGLFQTGLSGERPAFEHSARTAAGALFHKSIELDVVTERALDARSLCERAAVRLDADQAFDTYWAGLDPIERAELLTEAGRHLSLFRDSFPPLQRRWAPQPELRVKVRLAGGRVILSGAPDLVLGRTRRLTIDFKSGRAWPEHPEDMRFYALLFLLRTGVPPYRVATFFLDSGEWQAEDVDEIMLARGADRVVQTASVAAVLAGGLAPALSPGRHCGWCDRARTCPVALAAPPGGDRHQAVA